MDQKEHKNKWYKFGSLTSRYKPHPTTHPQKHTVQITTMMVEMMIMMVMMVTLMKLMTKVTENHTKQKHTQISKILCPYPPHQDLYPQHYHLQIIL